MRKLVLLLIAGVMMTFAGIPAHAGPNNAGVTDYNCSYMSPDGTWNVILDQNVPFSACVSDCRRACTNAWAGAPKETCTPGAVFFDPCWPIPGSDCNVDCRPAGG